MRKMGGLATEDKSIPEKSSLRPKLRCLFRSEICFLGAETVQGPRWHPTPKRGLHFGRIRQEALSHGTCVGASPTRRMPQWPTVRHVNDFATRAVHTACSTVEQKPRSWGVAHVVGHCRSEPLHDLVRRLPGCPRGAAVGALGDALARDAHLHRSQQHI